MEKKFQKQYEEFQFEKEEQPSLDQLLVSTLIKSDELEEEVYGFEYQKRKRLFWQKLSTFVTLPKKDIELYEHQIHWLNQKIGIINVHQDYFDQIMQISNTENADELLKLLHFTYDHYQMQMSGQKESIEDSMEFDTFFQGKINELHVEDVVEKRNVIW